MFPEFVNKSKKKKMMKEAVSWYKSKIGTPKEIVFGWFKSDAFLEKLASKFNLKVVKEHFHIYDWWL